MKNKKYLGTLTGFCFRGKGDRDANTVNVISILVTGFHFIITIRNQGIFLTTKMETFQFGFHFQSGKFPLFNPRRKQ